MTAMSLLIFEIKMNGTTGGGIRLPGDPRLVIGPVLPSQVKSQKIIRSCRLRKAMGSRAAVSTRSRSGGAAADAGWIGRRLRRQAAHRTDWQPGGIDCHEASVSGLQRMRMASAAGNSSFPPF